MSSPAEDIADLLSDSTINAGTLGANLFVGEEPAQPINCVSVFDTGGFDSDAEYDYQRPTVMVRVRNVRYNTGYSLAKRIRDGLHGLSNIEINDSRIIGVWLMGDINGIGKDNNQHQIFTINFRLHRTAAE